MAEIMDPTDGHLDEDRIFGLAEGGLDASARAAAEAHLRGCSACRRELETAAIYFKEAAGLEPVKAPANFLANVRARLPRPSPLRAFLDNFMRPLRVIPMQVALLTILGLTAISSYLYQRGGLHKDVAGVISESPAKRPEPASASPAAGSESLEKPMKPQAPPRPVASAPLAKDFEARDAMKSDSRGTSALGKSEAYAASPKPGAGASDALAPSPKKSSQALRLIQKQARPVQAPADLEDDAAPASRQAAPPAPSVAMESAPAAEAARADQPRAAKEAVKEKKAEAKGGFNDKTLSGSKDMEDSHFQEALSSLVLGNAGAMGSAEHPAFIVRLAPGKRVGEAVSGLKAMGADSLSAWTAGDSAGKGMDYVFRVPASMRKEIAPYLQRYGKTEGADLLPAAGSATSQIQIRIRFLP